MNKFNTLFITIPIHPLLYITFAYALGITLNVYIATVCALALTIIVFIAYIIKRCRIDRSHLWYIALPAMLLVGSARFKHQKKIYDQLFDSINNQTIDVIGTVQSITKQQNPLKYQIVLSHCTIKKQIPLSPWTTIHQTVILNSLKRPDIICGDTIIFFTIKPKKMHNPEFYFYSLKENIGLTFSSFQLQYKTLHSPHFSLLRMLNNYKEKLLNDCKHQLNPLAFSLYASIFLGYKPENKTILTKTKNYCRIWGLSHFLARSGLHLVLFIAILTALCNMLPLAIKTKNIFLILISYFYFIVSYPSISFIRAVLTFFLYQLCGLLDVTTPFLYLITLVALCVLIYNPAQLFFLDFQLSFGLTYALAWFNLLHKHKLIMNKANIAS